MFDYDIMSASEKSMLAWSASDECDHDSKNHDIMSASEKSTDSRMSARPRETALCGIFRGMRKADIILLLASFAAAAAIFFIWRAVSGAGSAARISYDGNMVSEILLEQPEACYILLTYPENENAPVIEEFSEREWESVEPPDTEYNLLMCKDGEIRMLESTCPDKLCVNRGAASGIGESIICLPHKLAVEITGGGENELDGVAY